jgi:iron-sulfur cluster repair protein YtfE (RIC family)
VGLFGPDKAMNAEVQRLTLQVANLDQRLQAAEKDHSVDRLQSAKELAGLSERVARLEAAGQTESIKDEIKHLRRLAEKSSEIDAQHGRELSGLAVGLAAMRDAMAGSGDKKLQQAAQAIQINVAGGTAVGAVENNGGNNTVTGEIQK